MYKIWRKKKKLLPKDLLEIRLYRTIKTKIERPKNYIKNWMNSKNSLK
jgi:hypothetical protein